MGEPTYHHSCSYCAQLKPAPQKAQLEWGRTSSGALAALTPVGDEGGMEREGDVLLGMEGKGWGPESMGRGMWERILPALGIKNSPWLLFPGGKKSWE